MEDAVSDIGSLTEKKALLLIKTLRDSGVKKFFISPGSRSAPLALAAREIARGDTEVHFDERGLGFYALGFAKASRDPVAVIVTSGTAVANLFPAVAEAGQAGIPFLVLTADRPPELKQCGANQTMPQSGIFSPHTVLDIELPLSDPGFSDDYLVSSASYAVFRARSDDKGPVQINCPIREPSFSLFSPKYPERVPCVYEPTEPLPSSASFAEWSKILSSANSGILVLGSDAVETDAAPVIALAERIGFPIFSDIISGGRKIGSHDCHIEYFPMLLKLFPDIRIDTVLQIGDRIVSKTLASVIDNQTKHRLLVAPHTRRQDPSSSVTRRMQCRTDRFCNTLLSYVDFPVKRFASYWKQQSRLVEEILSEHFRKQEALTEPYLPFFFRDFPSLFLANSMPIRNADSFLFSPKGTPFLQANRGVSGIDGNIASAVGMAEGLQRPTIALIGDISCLHDLNSLSLLVKSRFPVYLVIVNNGGGGIFSFLPIAKKTEACAEMFTYEHGYSFKKAAEMFSLPFFSVNTCGELRSAFESLPGTSAVIECNTAYQTGPKDLETLYQTVKNTLCSLLEQSDVPLLVP